MKTSFLLPVMFILVSCGNPHIYSSKGGIEQTNSPLVTEETCETSEQDGIQFLVDSNEDLSHCQRLINEDFNGFPVARSTSLTNQDKEKHAYKLQHVKERRTHADKVIHLTDLFNTDTFSISLEGTISKDMTNGVDQGAKAEAAKDGSKEAFLWSFSEPIRYWKVTVIDLHNRSVLRLFGCNQELLQEKEISYPFSKTGDKETHNLGFLSNEEEICYVTLSEAVVNEDIAIDDFKYMTRN